MAQTKKHSIGQLVQYQLDPGLTNLKSSKLLIISVEMKYDKILKELK